jgi:tetraacyldisaccharide 4'-kinase
MRTPDFWTNPSFGARALATLLSPLGALYGLSVRVRQAASHPYRSRAKVVCVGNLTAGGTGKTPVALAIGRMLMARGKTIAFLSRGYGGNLDGPVVVDPLHHRAADVGDEPLLLASVATTIVSKDRAAGAKLADSLGVDIIIMDDGFQNFQIAKDLSVVVVNAASGFGNGKLIPAGPLRESVSGGLARADAVVRMGQGDLKLPFAGPVLYAQAMPVSPDALKNRAVFAFAGIGHPERFFDLVKRTGANLAGTQTFADHHVFGDAELSVLRFAAEKLGAQIVTTEKDFVRLSPGQRDGIEPVPVQAVFDDEAALAGLLDRIAPARKVLGA